MGDPSLGPCIGCASSGEDAPVPHTMCECDNPECLFAICDSCRFGKRLWAWAGDGEDAREMHVSCYERASQGEAR